ncbi:type III pantothenate kinase [Marinomonas sp. PE14-40]|uniref:type III pantothenate kinase n=1 Tax=Marinomonas sp. PE14-40 TaxID=3060621 RepID=UPI003F674ADD
MSANNKVLVVDAGNTCVKWAAFDGDDLLRIGRDIQLCPAESIDEAGKDILAYQPDHIYFASVRSPEQETLLRDFIANQFVGVPCHELKSEPFSCGVTNSYDDVLRLGVDRWLTVLAAYDRMQDTLIIDAGTALKIEFVPATGQYQGGYIVPGQAMMESMLVANTGKIRFNEDDLQDYQGIINNTGLAVHLGCWEMTLALVERVYGQNKKSRCVFTGGNGEKIMKALGIKGLFEPNLVLLGAKKLGDEWVSQA